MAEEKRNPTEELKNSPPSQDTASRQGNNAQEETLGDKIMDMAKESLNEDESPYSEQNYLSQLNDVPVKVTAVLGSSQLRVSELASLNSGSIVELDRKIGDQVDIFVNDHLVAHGEVVINDGHLGISLTEIISNKD